MKSSFSTFLVAFLRTVNGVVSFIKPPLSMLLYYLLCELRFKEYFYLLKSTLPLTINSLYFIIMNKIKYKKRVEVNAIAERGKIIPELSHLKNLILLFIILGI